MRSICCGLFLATLLTSPVAATELQVLSIPLFHDGASDLAANYTKKTGQTVVAKADVIGKLMGEIQSGTPAPDVIILPTKLMNALEKRGGVKEGTRVPLGRVEIALAVRAGTPHPDISTVAKLSAALQNAKMVVYTKPGPPRNSMEASIIDSILKRPEFVGVHTTAMEKTSGILALLHGDGDMALQGIPSILPHKDAEIIGPLPSELGAYYDAAVAVSARTTDEPGARAFIRYITGPDAALVWKSRGIVPF